MLELASLEHAILAVALLSPGFLLLFGRSQFLTGRIKGVASGSLEYLMVSSIYYALAFPIYKSSGGEGYFSLLIFLLIGPLGLGLLLGFMSQKNWLRSALGWFGLNLVHHTPTGWDHAFGGRVGEYWVVVNLHSGGVFYGVWGGDSLASSDLSRRDIFIEDVRTRDFQPVEKDGRKRSVWISEVDIRSIEIIKDNQDVKG
ncbi:DUF6338 family protein [Jannaschia ovalis]|uniref:DUF6338 family protein n=1 Tax=Jannaschia ovalis TaxID=3038773 RepID=A0ABY8LEK8_9RHOB|nr:DUF6338 family protein [Jannaschia sp. GRR-S6-38]WGH79748.1 DUF6338 family protein [Jannaschia sp. GRR-S6-38]